MNMKYTSYRTESVCTYELKRESLAEKCFSKPSSFSEN